MILYHFCAEFSKDGILSEGIRLGQFAYFTNGDYKFIPNCQWLTKDANPKNQSWATTNIIDYSRTAYRMTINIPNNRHKKLIRAVDFVHDMSGEAKQIVNGWFGSENWYIYCGKIPPQWILGCHRMEEL
ncbi:MAG: hypothetical protein M0R51_17725 [Clostridia bacterium]|nr:hypothetical protein [Clostridia bacterium]